MEYRRGSGHLNAHSMSRRVTPWECQCNEVDTMEPLKCGPCKRCVKRALDMKSSLLMSRMNVKAGELCQPWEGSDCKGISDMCQVTHVTESTGPNDNGQGKESGVELKSHL